MKPPLYDPASPKKATNVSINSDVLDRAKALKINLSKTLEEQLVELLRQQRRQQWLAENRKALDEYAEYIEREGVFSDGVRLF